MTCCCFRGQLRKEVTLAWMVIIWLEIQAGARRFSYITIGTVAITSFHLIPFRIIRHDRCNVCLIFSSLLGLTRGACKLPCDCQNHVASSSAAPDPRNLLFTFTENEGFYQLEYELEAWARPPAVVLFDRRMLTAGITT